MIRLSGRALKPGERNDERGTVDERRTMNDELKNGRTVFSFQFL